MTDDPRDPGADVAIYVHWPYCARICPYCDFNVVRDRGRVDEQTALVDAILADLEAQARRLKADDGQVRRLASIFFGGGTPSLMPPRAVERVIARVFALFPPRTAGIEVTLEANPTDAEAGRFADLSRAGINRLSLGVQALDDTALAFLGRDHTAAEARRAAATAARVFPRLSVDLIYARPDQTPDAWAAELGDALKLGFEHVSPYQLTVEPATAFGRAFARGRLIPPDEDTAAALYETTQSVLTTAGFDAYEVSNHARGVSARSAHNLHVWRGGDYLGLGPGAHGRLTLGGVRAATIAHRRVTDYVAGVAAGAPWAEHTTPDARESVEERILLGLRTVEGIPLDLMRRLGLDARTPSVSHMLEDGFLVLEAGRVAATARGRPVLDAVLKTLLT